MTGLARATTGIKDEVTDSAEKNDEIPRTFDSHELLGDGDEVVIRHDGRTYRLRRTRLGKLILTA